MKTRFCLLAYLLLLAFSATSQEVLQAGDCKPYVMRKLQEIKKDFLEIHDSYSKNQLLDEAAVLPYFEEKHFYDTNEKCIERVFQKKSNKGNSNLGSVRAFLQELSLIKIEDIRLKGISNCKFCQNPASTYFFTTRVTVQYYLKEKAKRNKTILKYGKKQKVDFNIEFYFEGENVQFDQGKIGRIVFSNSQNASNCAVSNPVVPELPSTDQINNPAIADSGASTETNNPSRDKDSGFQSKGNNSIFKKEKEFKVTISKKNKEIRAKKREIAALKAQLAQLKIDTTNKNFAIKQKEKVVKQLIIEKDRIRDSLVVMTDILECIKQADNLGKTGKEEARQKLSAATKKYKDNLLSPIMKEKLSEEEIEGIIKETWETYMEFRQGEVSIKCGDLDIVYEQNYKTAEESLLMAQMIASNEGNILDLIKGDEREQVNISNRILMTELGKAMESGYYDVRSASQRIVDRLPDLVVQERKTGEGSEIAQKIKAISSLFSQGRYAEAIGLYGKFHRFFGLKEIRENYQKEILEAKYCAGAILSWNLGDIAYYKALYVDNKQMNKNEEIRIATGRDLLVQVMNNKSSASEELRRKAAIALAKQYHQ